MFLHQTSSIIVRLLLSSFPQRWIIIVLDVLIKHYQIVWCHSAFHSDYVLFIKHLISSHRQYILSSSFSIILMCWWHIITPFHCNGFPSDWLCLHICNIAAKVLTEMHYHISSYTDGFHPDDCFFSSIIIKYYRNFVVLIQVHFSHT